MFGVAGPLIFLVGIIAVGWGARSFMDELGWEEWPSGTALGPHGWATVLVFLITGACQIVFALSLLAQVGPSLVRRLGAGLLLVSGVGMAVLAFKADRPDADMSWHGTLHVIGYFTFFLGLLLAYVALAWGSWNRFSRSSWKYAPLALLPWLGAFVLPDGLPAGDYLFFAILLTPLLIFAMRVLVTGGWPVERRVAQT